MMRWIFVALFVLIIACQGSNEQHDKTKRWMYANDKVRVLATTEMICDLVSQVGGEHIDCLTLIQGDLDPHSYQPVKGDDEKFARADVIFFNGLGLEHGPSWDHYLHSQEKAFGVGNQIQERFPALILYDDCGIRDPHIWTDISLWARAVPIIVEALSAQDALHAKEYQENGEALYQSLLDAHERARQKMEEVPEQFRYFVTSHDAFNYFARAYLATDEEREMATWHKRFAAPEGLSPDAQLSTADITAIIEHLKEYQVHVLFPESNLSQDSIKKILCAGKEMGLELTIADTPLYGDAMGPKGSNGDTYLKMVQHNIDTISRYLLCQVKLP